MTDFIWISSWYYCRNTNITYVCVCVWSCEISVRFPAEASSSSSKAANQSVTDECERDHLYVD